MLGKSRLIAIGVIALALATLAIPALAQNPTVQIATDPKLGQILTDPKGMTLYTFANDTANTSNCSVGCATAWPPLLLASGNPEAPQGLPGTLGVITRADGGRQVTYDAKPLYTFANDTKPGDTNGQGLNNVWYVVVVTQAAGTATIAATTAAETPTAVAATNTPAAAATATIAAAAAVTATPAAATATSAPVLPKTGGKGSWTAIILLVGGLTLLGGVGLAAPPRAH